MLNQKIQELQTELFKACDDITIYREKAFASTKNDEFIDRNISEAYGKSTIILMKVGISEPHDVIDKAGTLIFLLKQLIKPENYTKEIIEEINNNIISIAVEKQQIEYKQEIIDLRHELSLQREQAKEWERELNYKILELQQLQKQYHLLEETHAIINQQNHKNNHEIAVFQERYEQYGNVINIREKELAKKDIQIIEMEKQVAILTEQTHFLQKNISHAEEKIETLRHEKIFIMQEKSELQGCLKQLGHMNV